MEERCFPHKMIPTPDTSPEGCRVGNPRSKERNMLRSIWWWAQGCSEHCQSPSALPKSRDLGPGRGACLLAPVPWETEIWDMSLPIISFTSSKVMSCRPIVEKLGSCSSGSGLIFTVASSDGNEAGSHKL